MKRLLPVLSCFLLSSVMTAQNAVVKSDVEPTNIYIVPFSLLAMLLTCPIYGYMTWYVLRKIMRKKRSYTGFLTWGLIIQAAIVPVFWILHFAGALTFVEAPSGHFDPVNISGHEFGFFLTYFLFTGILTIVVLTLVKWRSV